MGWLGEGWEAEGDGNLLVIDSVTDYERVRARFGEIIELAPDYRVPRLDFPAIAEAYDGIYLTAAGEGAVRFLDFSGGGSTRFDLSLYGWDCETVLWFRWRFGPWSPLSPSLPTTERPIGPTAEREGSA